MRLPVPVHHARRSAIRYAPVLPVLAVLLGVMASCALLDNQNGYIPPAGYLYQSNTVNRHMSPNSDVGSRTGEACAESWLGLVSTGEAGIKQAAAAGAILTVKAVDYRITRVLAIGYVKVCTIAYGD